MLTTFSLTALLVKYRYWVIFPLACFEGPLISLAVGFLIHQGYFAALPTYCLLIFGDLIPDTFYFYLGRVGDQKELVSKYFGQSKIITGNLPLIAKLWQDHPKKTMFFSKLAYGLSTPFLISAGLVKMSYRQFLTLATPITLVQYAVILSLGYYLGQSYQMAEVYFKNGALVVAGILIIFIGAYLALSRYAQKKIKALEQTELN